MPYCTNCGKKLEDGEVCSCTAQTQEAAVQNEPPVQQAQQVNTNGQQPYSGAPQYGQPYNGGMQPPPYPNNGQPYPNQYPYPGPQGYQYAYDGQMLPPPPKKSKAWILAIVIPLGIVALMIIVILAAIFVPAMLGYTKKSKQSTMNSRANTIFKAANTAMVELDEDGAKVDGVYIISSDQTRNTAVPFDIKEFYELEAKYYDEINEYDYFIVFNKGCAVYSAVSDSWDDKKSYIGSYPSGGTSGARLYSPDGSAETADDKDTLADLYRDALNKVR